MQANKAKVRSKTSNKRQDPRARHVEGVRHRIVNPNPNKKYVLAYKGCPDFGPTEYQHQGYEVEEYRAGGVTFSGITADVGKEIEYKDHVLMSIDKERAEEIEQYGLFGDSGQSRADEIEAYIIDKERGDVDTMRGQRGLRTINKTGAPEEERPF